MKSVTKESKQPNHAMTAAISVLVGITMWGCDIPPRPPLASTNKKNTGKNVQEVDVLPTINGESAKRMDIGRFPGNWESWDAYYIRGNHVGYSHTKAEAEPGDSEGNITYQVEDQLKVRRGQSVVLQHLTQTSTETRGGDLISFEGELRIGPVNNQFYGRNTQDNLVVETTRGSSVTTREIEWKPEMRGLVAVRQSLGRKPMKRGEVRKFEMLLPAQYQVASITLSCSGTAAVALLDGEHRELTEINSQLKIGEETTIESILWTDEEGRTEKSYLPAMQLVTYRTDKKTALKDAVNPQDLITATGIDVTGKLERPEDAKRVAFAIKPSSLVRDSEDMVAIQPAPDQYIRKLPDGTYQILVSRIVENVQKGFVASDLGLSDDDLKPNALVDYKTALIKRMAAAAVSGDDMADVDIALDLTRTVKQLINVNNYSHGLTKASAVAQDGEGDCSGRSVLLAALLRAQEIPSRVAAGLVYMPGDQPRMVYHMWTLAYVDGRWMALDPSLGQQAPPDRITLVTTNLSGGDEYKSLSPILDVMGRIKIQVLRAQY